jgi:hypothetical protein
VIFFLKNKAKALPVYRKVCYISHLIIVEKDLGGFALLNDWSSCVWDIVSPWVWTFLSRIVVVRVWAEMCDVHPYIMLHMLRNNLRVSTQVVLKLHCFILLPLRVHTITIHAMQIHLTGRWMKLLLVKNRNANNSNVMCICVFV